MDKTKDPATAQKILTAALGLWAEKGYAVATMRELARRVGMGASSLYAYFASKDAIVQYLYVQLNERVRAQFREQDRGEVDVGKNLKAFLLLKLALAEPQRASLAVLLKEAIDPSSALNPTSRESAGVLEIGRAHV